MSLDKKFTTNLNRVLLKVVNPNVDVNVDVTYGNFAFYQTSYLTCWRRSTTDSTCAFVGTSYDLLTIIIGIAYQ